MTTTSIDRNVPVSGTERPQDAQTGTAGPGQGKGRAESALRVAARRRGLTMGELAEKMGTTPSHLSQIATENKPWTPRMREKAEEVLERSPDRASSTGREAWSAGRAATSGSGPGSWA